jgi:hypothetical protein
MARILRRFGEPDEGDASPAGVRAIGGGRIERDAGGARRDGVRAPGFDEADEVKMLEASSC